MVPASQTMYDQTVDSSIRAETARSLMSAAANAPTSARTVGDT
jgi:hypothetical protein